MTSVPSKIRIIGAGALVGAVLGVWRAMALLSDPSDGAQTGFESWGAFIKVFAVVIAAGVGAAGGALVGAGVWLVRRR